MSLLPEQLIASLRHLPAFNEQAFREVHNQEGTPVSIRLNPAKPFPEEAGLGRYSEQVPWCSLGQYLAERPPFTFDPLLHAGAYYVQEASSMFVAQAFLQHKPEGESLRVLDLCAAPGGKSTLLQSLIGEEDLLVSNEVIRSRASILEENCTKWGGANLVVTNNDPRDFNRLKGYFDVVVVDAPCSGSGLFRKDPDAISEWSPENVALCSQRQQRILADIWPALKDDGLLIYSTCSYSEEEDEQVADWMMENLEAESLKIAVDPSWGVVETESRHQHAFGYRFYPNRLRGEGFYLSCFRKKSVELDSWTIPSVGKKKINHPVPTDLIRNVEKFVFRPLADSWLAIPAAFEADLQLLQSSLYLKKAGVLLGKPSPKEWIPEHALALSGIAGASIPVWELNRTDALRYLRREIPEGHPEFRGWGMVTYAGLPLGWIKALPNRINNHYPQNWRILKREA